MSVNHYVFPGDTSASPGKTFPITIATNPIYAVHVKMATGDHFEVWYMTGDHPHPAPGTPPKTVYQLFVGPPPTSVMVQHAHIAFVEFPPERIA